MDGAYKINMNTLEPVWNVEIKLVDEEGQKLIDTQNNIGKAFAMEESLTKGKSYYLIITSYPLLTGRRYISNLQSECEISCRKNNFKQNFCDSLYWENVYSGT